MAKPRLGATSADTTQLAEVLRLSLMEGLSIRAIACRLQLSRKTVRKLLGRAPPPKTPLAEMPRGSLLDVYDAEIRRLVADTPELTAPTVLEKLRSLGYTGGITILRDRLRGLRPAIPEGAWEPERITDGYYFVAGVRPEVTQSLRPSTVNDRSMVALHDAS